MLLLDVNVLIHAWRPGAERHDEYRAWLQSMINSDALFGASELVLSGFLRVMTNPKLFARPSARDDAFAFVNSLRDQPNCIPLNPGARHWSIFMNLCRVANARGNMVADAYHAALALEHRCEWITTDRHFARFPGLQWRHPLDD